MGTIVYGSEISKELKEQMKSEIDVIKASGARVPCLAVILVGNNPASLSYVKGKEKACQEIGILSKMIHLDENSSQEDVIKVIKECNEDKTVDGILVQLPLPKHIQEVETISNIDPEKDVDGLHPLNIGRLYNREKGFVPCTPRGIMEVLNKMNVDLDGKEVVVLGRSKLVGNPVAQLLQNKNATVTICHSHTKNLQEVTKRADVLIVAIGRPEMIDHTYIKKGVYIIDVGINRTSEGKLVGDVNLQDVLADCAAITPVPKGVGPMTICMLLENTLEAYTRR